jgi:transketolase
MRSRDPRETFARTAAGLVEDDSSVALVCAEISGQFFGEVEHRHPDRVVNVGIREQLLVNAGTGFALAGMRPIVQPSPPSSSSGPSSRSSSG